ncbi:glycosyltransferase family 4 protein [Fibrella forsythiae]|uniref:Glycosyltransferase family 4 protein n=1 Tax=Fibrella forsythiae TaxID=2817061 RepID=A0ABS3JI00_9BACT|nr:glycosyltransferase family 4 protein [Fibrella forsythiae]MBO0949642.1 glycosyltransferase family 4 protein [Fibrella forsythiae]
MEIIHLVLGKANPARMNGVNKVVNELASQQQQAGYAVEVWGFSANQLHDYPERTYTTRLFEASRNPFWVGADWKRAMLVRKGTAVVQIHGGFVPRFYAAARFLADNRIPYVVTPHGNYNWHALQRNRLTKRLYFNLFERKVLSGASAIHALGKSEIAGLQTMYPNQKSVLIPYGFSVYEQPGEPIDSTFIIGFCGRLDIDHKGLDWLMDGFADFQKNVPTARLWLIGDGPHRLQLKQMADDRNVGQQVTFWGSRFGEEKLQLLGLCSLFVHSSRYEGLPVSVLEAASLGLPCLVSEATNVGDAIRAFDAGYVVEQGTAPQVAEGLTVLHDQWQTGELAQLGRNAREMVDKHYNWPRQVKQFNELYQQVWHAN